MFQVPSKTSPLYSSKVSVLREHMEGKDAQASRSNLGPKLDLEGRDCPFI